MPGVAQSVKQLSLDSDSSHDLRVVGQNPQLGPGLSRESAGGSLSLSAPPAGSFSK